MTKIRKLLPSKLRAVKQLAFLCVLCASAFQCIGNDRELGFEGKVKAGGMKRRDAENAERG